MHYVDSNDWKSAVNMYRAHELWDDAIRVGVCVCVCVCDMYRAHELWDDAIRVGLRQPLAYYSIKP